MNLAVLTYEFEENPNNIPIRWPARVIELGDASILPGENWQLMTVEQLNSYKAKFQSDYDYWEASFLNRLAGNEKLKAIVQNAMKFGDELSEKFIMENVALGITQAGMTSKVRKSLTELSSCLSSGSLYDAIAEVRRIPPENKDPIFISDARLLKMLNAIEAYLGLRMSTSI